MQRSATTFVTLPIFEIGSSYTYNVEGNLRILVELRRWQSYLQSNHKCIDEPYTRGTPTLPHQVFSPEYTLDEGKDQYIVFTYNNKAFNDVNIQ